VTTSEYLLLYVFAFCVVFFFPSCFHILTPWRWDFDVHYRLLGESRTTEQQQQQQQQQRRLQDR